MKKQVTVIYPADDMSHRQSDKKMQIEVEIEPGSNDFVICERVWRYMNRVDGSEIEQQLDKYQERSMMVGDLIEFDEKRYLVDMVGFKKVKNERQTS